MGKFVKEKDKNKGFRVWYNLSKGGINIAVQVMEWGYIDWKHVKSENNPRQNMNIGIVVIEPGRHLAEHVHYGQEQLLYVLQGEGIYYINGERIASEPGQIFYMEAGSSHEVYNPTGGQIRELLVSNPVYGAEEISIDTLVNLEAPTDDTLYAAVEGVRQQSIDPLKLPLTIYDTGGKTVLQTSCFPGYCMEHCDPLGSGDYPCRGMGQANLSEPWEYRQFVCPYGLTLYQQPIVHENRCIGVIQGGYILLSTMKSEGKTSDRTEELYDTPESTALSIRMLLKRIAEHIVSFCVFSDARKVLEAKERDIDDAQEYSKELEKNLQAAQNIVTDLRINHHFLFNTLNCMAGMALEKDAYELYDAIIDLAKMFRYTTRTREKFVPFSQEVAYLKTYLKLQKLRYEDSLQVDMKINAGLSDWLVPFNFLQPIAENAFTHGFDTNNLKRRLSVTAQPSGSKVLISIYNNGAVIDYVTLNRINESLPSGSGHGLSLIYAKLQTRFGPDFSMNVYSDERIGTWIILEMPYSYQKEVENHD